VVRRAELRNETSKASRAEIYTVSMKQSGEHAEVRGETSKASRAEEGKG
jgi:hypothetical protein